MTVIGEIDSFPKTQWIEWKIKDFTLSKIKDKPCSSPLFSLHGESWNLVSYLNVPRSSDSFEYNDSLCLIRKSGGSPIRVEISVALKNMNREKHMEKHFTKVFDPDISSVLVIPQFISTPELVKRWSELVPSGSLTFICSMTILPTTGNERTMPLIKIWNFDRSMKKIAFTDNINQLKEIAKANFNYTDTDLKIVFEQDGTEIDDEEVFHFLIHDPTFSQTIFQVMPGNKVWMPTNADIPNLIKFDTDAECCTDVSSTITITEVYASASEASTSISNREPELVYETEDHSQKIAIPWEKFPKYFLKDCAAQKVPNSADRRKVVRQIVAAIREKNKNPPKKFLENIAKDIIIKYPSLSDSIGPKKYQSFLTQLENRLYNCNRHKHDEKKIRFSEERKIAPVYKKKKVTQGQTFEYQEEANITSQNEKKEWLKVQHEMNAYSDEVLSTMACTYISQRLTINSKTVHICNIYEEWPYLFQRQCFLQHASILMKFDAERRWKKQLTLNIPHILKVFRNDQKKYQKLKSILEAIDKNDNEDISKVIKECSLLPLLSKFFNEDQSLIIKYFESTNSIQEVLDSLKENIYPVIAVFGNDVLENPQACVCINGKCIGDLATYIDQVLLACVAYYIFNIPYQTGIEATLEFVQRCIFNFEPIKGRHKRGRKRRRDDVHPLVLQLANRLSSLESICGISGDE